MHTAPTRRRFILLTPLGGLALLAACSPPAPPPAPPAPAPSPAPTPAAAPGVATASAVDEASPLAQSLGYVADAARVDRARFAGYVSGSRCSNCALYQGPSGSVSGPCPIFASQTVAADGWCSTWAKKA